jgi:hypothetical protein
MYIYTYIYSYVHIYIYILAGWAHVDRGYALDAAMAQVLRLGTQPTTPSGLKLLATSVRGLKLLATSVRGLRLLATSYYCLNTRRRDGASARTR